MTLTVYGIKNCSSVKQALSYLDAHKIEYAFYDYKKHAIAQSVWTHFVTAFTLDTLINKKGTTYKKLPEDTKHSLDDAINNNDLKMVYGIVYEHTSLLKRPIVLGDGVALIGFDVARFKESLPSR